MRIRIHKRAEVSGGAPARDRYDHVDGHAQPEGFSLPLDYEIEGVLLGALTVGKPVSVLRDNRNGVKALGAFQTSPVTEVTDKTFRTRNSVYDYQYLNDNP